jgi:hypothetical protein
MLAPPELLAKSSWYQAVPAELIGGVGKQATKCRSASDISYLSADAK